MVRVDFPPLFPIFCPPNVPFLVGHFGQSVRERIVGLITILSFLKSNFHSWQPINRDSRGHDFEQAAIIDKKFLDLAASWNSFKFESCKIPYTMVGAIQKKRAKACLSLFSISLWPIGERNIPPFLVRQSQPMKGGLCPPLPPP